MLALELRAAAKHLAKASNQIKSLDAAIALEAAQHELDRHHQLGSGKFDGEALALPGPVVKSEDLRQYSIESTIGIDVSKENRGGTSAVKMQATSSDGVSGKEEKALRTEYLDRTLEDSVK